MEEPWPAIPPPPPPAQDRGGLGPSDQMGLNQTPDWPGEGKGAEHPKGWLACIAGKEVHWEILPSVL